MALRAILVGAAVLLAGSSIQLSSASEESEGNFIRMPDEPRRQITVIRTGGSSSKVAPQDLSYEVEVPEQTTDSPDAGTEYGVRVEVPEVPAKEEPAPLGSLKFDIEVPITPTEAPSFSLPDMDVKIAAGLEKQDDADVRYHEGFEVEVPDSKESSPRLTNLLAQVDRVVINDDPSNTNPSSGETVDPVPVAAPASAHEEAPSAEHRYSGVEEAVDRQRDGFGGDAVRSKRDTAKVASVKDAENSKLSAAQGQAGDSLEPNLAVADASQVRGSDEEVSGVNKRMCDSPVIKRTSGNGRTGCRRSGSQRPSSTRYYSSRQQSRDCGCDTFSSRTSSNAWSNDSPTRFDLNTYEDSPSSEDTEYQCRSTCSSGCQRYGGGSSSSPQRSCSCNRSTQPSAQCRDILPSSLSRKTCGTSQNSPSLNFIIKSYVIPEEAVKTILKSNCECSDNQQQTSYNRSNDIDWYNHFLREQTPTDDRPQTWSGEYNNNRNVNTQQLSQSFASGGSMRSSWTNRGKCNEFQDGRASSPSCGYSQTPEIQPPAQNNRAFKSHDCDTLTSYENRIVNCNGSKQPQTGGRVTSLASDDESRDLDGKACQKPASSSRSSNYNVCGGQGSPAPACSCEEQHASAGQVRSLAFNDDEDYPDDIGMSDRDYSDEYSGSAESQEDYGRSSVRSSSSRCDHHKSAIALQQSHRSQTRGNSGSVLVYNCGNGLSKLNRSGLRKSCMCQTSSPSSDSRASASNGAEHSPSCTCPICGNRLKDHHVTYIRKSLEYQQQASRTQGSPASCRAGRPAPAPSEESRPASSPCECSRSAPAPSGTNRPAPSPCGSTRYATSPCEVPSGGSRSAPAPCGCGSSRSSTAPAPTQCARCAPQPSCRQRPLPLAMAMRAHTASLPSTCEANQPFPKRCQGTPGSSAKISVAPILHRQMSPPTNPCDCQSSGRASQLRGESLAVINGWDTRASQSWN